MTTSNRSVVLRFTDGLDIPNLSYGAPENTSSPGVINTITLASGNNTITKPDDAVAVTIIPPSDNATAMTLKGINGDTGVGLHLTAPTSIGLADAVTTFVINAGAEITGVRLIWS